MSPGAKLKPSEEKVIADKIILLNKELMKNPINLEEIRCQMKFLLEKYRKVRKIGVNKFYEKLGREPRNAKS